MLIEADISHATDTSWHQLFVALSGFLDPIFAATSRLNQRETAVPFQLPDWNQWLPGTHPMDGFGSDFVNSDYNTFYQTLSSNISFLNSTAYAGQKGNFDLWALGCYNLLVLEGTPVWADATLWTPSMVDAMASLPQWGLVKRNYPAVLRVHGNASAAPIATTAKP